MRGLKAWDFHHNGYWSFITFCHFPFLLYIFNYYSPRILLFMLATTFKLLCFEQYSQQYIFHVFLFSVIIHRLLQYLLWYRKFSYYPHSSFNWIHFISWSQSTPQCRVPCGAALKPWTNLAEFSLKKRWRYMMRTSAWQSRFRTSWESLISNENPSATIGPRSASSSKEKSCSERITSL